MEKENHCGLHCTKINNISVTIGKQHILENINIHIHCGELTVIIGKNGAGKSTMLKIIAGLQEPTRGNCVIPKDVTIGYLPQHMIHNDDKTDFEEAEKAFEYILSLQVML